jgi:hypothetical protein
MKNSIKVTGIMLVLVAVCSFSLNAQRGMRGMPDSTRMNRPGREMGMRQMMPPMAKRDSLFMKQMRGDFRGGMRGMGSGPGFRMQPGDRNGMRGMREFSGNRYGMRGRSEFQGDRFGMSPQFDGMMRIEFLPGLTDKQIADIAVLRVKQHSEMKKLRDEFATKMQAMREDQRKKITNLLTDEQKKQLETARGTTESAAPKSK